VFHLVIREKGKTFPQKEKSARGKKKPEERKKKVSKGGKVPLKDILPSTHMGGKVLLSLKKKRKRRTGGRGVFSW